MKKFLNKKTLISSAIVAVIFSVSTLGVYWSTVKVDKSNKQYESVNPETKNFFTRKEIDYANSTNIKLNIFKFRQEALYLLTDWRFQEITSKMQFLSVYISQSIIDYCKILIKDNAKFNLSNSLYINVKYSIVNDKKLIVDVRWADRHELVNNEMHSLYWNKFELNLQDLI